jgi:hypothetical protein
MDSGLLKKLFGPSPSWHGPCVVLVDAETSVKTTGPDSIVAGGTKSYAPRITSGRVAADAVCYQSEHHALLVVQRNRSKGHTGEDVLHQTLVILDTAHVVGVEFESIDRLAGLGLSTPPLPDKPHYAAGTLVG